MGLLGLFVKKNEVDALVKEIDGLKEERKEANEKLEELGLKKRIEEEEIAHMQRIEEERLKMDLDRKKLGLEQQYADRISDFKEIQTNQLVALHKELHEKMEGRFQSELGNLKEVYQAIMTKMPNVNMVLSKDLNGGPAPKEITNG